jgi:hypothetical protein
VKYSRYASKSPRLKVEIASRSRAAFGCSATTSPPRYPPSAVSSALDVSF